MDFVYTPTYGCPLGEPEDEWGSRIDQLLPYQVNSAVLKATGNPLVKFMHCLPALHNRDTEIVAKQIYAKRGLDVRWKSPTKSSSRQPPWCSMKRRTGCPRLQGPHDRHARPAVMRIVAALGGNALLERGEKPDEDIQEHHVQQAVTALAPLARSEDLVVTHGNGPQVGMLALESASDPALTRPYSLDVLGAQTQGMIGYWLVRALRGAAPGKHAASLVSQTRVDPDDPAFAHPTKFVGPVYEEKQARDLAAERGWVVARDGEAWRRVVPSPEPLELMELPLIRQLVDSGALVVCAGGGGIPVVADASGTLRGVEAVVDKDLTAALLACAVNADALQLLTDVDAVIDGYGTPDARPIRRTTPAELRARSFPASSSMGPKVEAWPAGSWRRPARWRRSGRLDAATALLHGEAGTAVSDSRH